MAIIYSYPQINLSSISADDLMIISDMNADGRPTKSLTLKNLADFVTSTGTGTGTTNKIIKWSDGPAGLLGDSIMNEDIDKIYVDGQLRIGSSSGTSSLQIFHGPLDSTTSFSSGGATGTQIIGRKNELYIENRGASRGDIIFKANNGENNGSADTYFLLDASMADIGVGSRYTRWPDNSHIVLGNASNPNNLDFEMYHDGSATIIKNGSSNLNIESKGGIYIENKNGGSGNIEISQSVTNQDIDITAYNGNYLRVDTSAGATIFYKPVEVPLVPAANANAASKQYVDQQIASIPAGLVFQGNWNANTNTPTLASGTGTVGNYYVVSVAGNTNLDGITDWEVGDWAVFVEVGGVDKWDKIDQTFVQGAGATGQVSFWSGINSVTGDNDFFWNNTNKRLGIGTNTPGYSLEVRGAGDQSLYLAKTGTTYLRATAGTNAELFTGGSMVLGSGNTERIRIASTGNVGIGTTSPSDKLTVSGNLSIFGNKIYNGSGANSAGVSFPSSTTRIDGFNGITFHSSTTTVGSQSERMRIANNGNVGIGTTSPAAALDVIGRIGLTDSNNNVSVGYQAGDAITTAVNNTIIGYNAGTNIQTGNDNTLIGYSAGANMSPGGTPCERNTVVGSGITFSLNPQGDDNTLVGYNAGKNIASGFRNILIGSLAGDNINLGADNVAIGYSALSAATGSARNIAIGSHALEVATPTVGYNVAIGFEAGKSVTTAIQNTLIGGLSGDSLTTGNNNTALGYAALRTETQGKKSVALGALSLHNQNNTSGIDVHNTAVGYNSGFSITTGTSNTIIGGLAGDALTTGNNNVALGYGALSAEVAGSDNIAIGLQAMSAANNSRANVAIGFNALQSLNYTSLSYSHNIGIGFDTGKNITTGTLNTLIGGLTGDSLTTGFNNIAIGYQASGAATIANNNVAIGVDALHDNVAGDRNVAIGSEALEKMTQASTVDTYNTAVGYNAGKQVTTGTDNTIIGGLAGDALTTGSRNTVLGMNALSTEDGHGRNTAIGWYALHAQDAGADAYNTAVGYFAGGSISTGTTNTLIGGLAGDALTTGDDNVAIGYNALGSETIGNGSVAIGARALEDQQSGAGAIILNTAVGYEAGKNINGGPGTGDSNTAIGGKALDAETTGQENTAVGVDALGGQTGADNNTALGWRAGYTTTTGSNVTLIGYNALASTATVSNEITLGDSNVTALRCAVTSITSLSDERDKSDIKDLTYGLELIDSLKPKEFVWDNRAEIDAEGNEFYSANKGKKDFGFIAQEVKELDDDTLRLVYDENPERLEMSYGKLVPILVKAIQELSAEVKILKNK